MLCCAWVFPAFRVRLEANATSFTRLYPRGDVFVKLQGTIAAEFRYFELRPKELFIYPKELLLTQKTGVRIMKASPRGKREKGQF